MTTDEPDEQAIHAPTDTEQAEADEWADQEQMDDDRADRDGANHERADHERALAETQRAHWQHTYRTHPHMYGRRPSSAAVHAGAAFRAAGAEDVLELGAGHGRDALWFAHEGFTVLAADFSPTGLEQLRSAARSQGLAERVTTVVHDVREPLPLPDSSVDAVFAHMLLCMALSTEEIHALVSEVGRVLRPGGVLVYTVRHTGDAHYGAGTAHGDDIFEHGGFAVHFFSRDLVESLADGWTLDDVHAFEEGDLPRRLWRVTQTLPPKAIRALPCSAWPLARTCAREAARSTGS